MHAMHLPLYALSLSGASPGVCASVFVVAPVCVCLLHVPALVREASLSAGLA